MPVWEATFAYTGSPSSWKVLPGLTQVTIVAQGAQGNALGGCERATVPVTPGDTLGIYVGGQGSATGNGGYNGGGDGGTFCCGGEAGGGGGGASDVRRGGIALANRVVVGGGGAGSSGGGWSGGVGGGVSGGTGDESSKYARGSGAGGSQTQGGKGAGGTDGSLGVGGRGGSTANGTFGGGGGGGGYYGGGGGRYSDHDAASGLDTGDSGGGGGSGFAEAGAVNVITTDGTRYGNGAVTIAWPQVMTSFQSGLSKPNGIAVDKAGNVYVATSKDYVTMFAPNGTATRVGTGFATALAVAVDTTGNVYVSDTHNQQVYKISPPFSTPTNGKMKLVVQGFPVYGLAVDGNDNVYATYPCGTNCGKILKIAPSGAQSVLAKDFYIPDSLAVDPTCTASCVFYETDRYDGFFGKTYYYFWKVDANGNKTPVTNTTLPSPFSVAVDASGNAYVVDGSLKAVQQVPIGGPPVQIGSGWGYPTRIAVNPSCKRTCPVYVTDVQNGLIEEVR